MLFCQVGAMFSLSDLWISISSKHLKKDLTLINDTFFQKLFTLSKCHKKLLQNIKWHHKMMKSFQSISKYGDFFKIRRVSSDKTIKFSLSHLCQMLHTQKGWLGVVKMGRFIICDLSDRLDKPGQNNCWIWH